mgnify:CR=1 FL=1
MLAFTLRRLLQGILTLWVVATLSFAVTRIAQGISAGMGFEYADPVTLTRAFEGRRGF